jgi:hypothetical protein
MPPIITKRWGEAKAADLPLPESIGKQPYDASSRNFRNKLEMFRAVWCFKPERNYRVVLFEGQENIDA